MDTSIIISFLSGFVFTVFIYSVWFMKIGSPFSIGFNFGLTLLYEVRLSVRDIAHGLIREEDVSEISYECVKLAYSLVSTGGDAVLSPYLVGLLEATDRDKAVELCEMLTRLINSLQRKISKRLKLAGRTATDFDLARLNSMMRAHAEISLPKEEDQI